MKASAVSDIGPEECVCVSEIVCVREKKSVREEEGEKLLAENSVSFTRKTMILQRIIFFFFL